jgi:outer membrane protein assembly factor BamB
MKHLFAVDTADGKQVWNIEWRTTYDVNAADPIVSGDLVFVSSAYNRGCGVWRLGGDAPQLVWKSRKMRNHMNSTVLYDRFLYGFDESTLRCLEFATGTEKWSQRGLGKGSLIVVGGRLLVLSEKGELIVAPASPDGFIPSARARVLTGTCWTQPTFADGSIYVRNAAGDLVCVDAGARP